MIPPIVQPGDVFQRIRMPNSAGASGEGLRVASVSGDLAQLGWASSFLPSAHVHPLSDISGLGTGVAAALAIATTGAGGLVRAQNANLINPYIADQACFYDSLNSEYVSVSVNGGLIKASSTILGTKSVVFKDGDIGAATGTSLTVTGDLKSTGGGALWSYDSGGVNNIRMMGQATQNIIQSNLPVKFLNFGWTDQAITASSATLSGTLYSNTINPYSGQTVTIGTGTGYNLKWDNNGLYSNGFAQPLGTASNPWGTVTTSKVESIAAAQLVLNGNNGTLQFQTGGYDRFQIGPANDFFPSVTNAYNIGQSAKRVLGFYGNTLDLTGAATINGVVDARTTVTGHRLGHLGHQDAVTLGWPGSSYGGFQAGNNGGFSWLSGALGLWYQSASVMQISNSSSAANALGSLACASVTASGTGTFSNGVTVSGSSSQGRIQTAGVDSLYLYSNSGQMYFHDGNSIARMTSGVFQFGTRSLTQVVDITASGTVTASGTGTHTFGTTNVVSMGSVNAGSLEAVSVFNLKQLNGSNNLVQLNANGVAVRNTSYIGWGSSASEAGGTTSASLTQSGGVVSVNTTTAANALGSLACATAILGAGAVSAPAISFGASLLGFYSNSADQLRFRTSTVVPVGFASYGMDVAVAGGYYGLGTGSPASGSSDVRWYRGSTGPTFDLCANGGARVRNLANNADAPIAASNVTASGEIVGRSGSYGVPTLRGGAGNGYLYLNSSAIGFVDSSGNTQMQVTSAKLTLLNTCAIENGSTFTSFDALSSGGGFRSRNFANNAFAPISGSDITAFGVNSIIRAGGAYNHDARILAGPDPSFAVGPMYRNDGTFHIVSATYSVLNFSSVENTNQRVPIATGNLFVGGSTANYFDNPTTGGGRWQTPYAGTFTFKSGQSGQSMILQTQTFEGKLAGIQQYDVSHANGRRMDLFSDPGVPILIRPANITAATFDTNGNTTFSGTSMTLASGLIFDSYTSQSRIFASSTLRYQSNNTTLQHLFSNQSGSALTGTVMQIDCGSGTMTAGTKLLSLLGDVSTPVLSVLSSGATTFGSAGYAMAAMGSGDIRLNNGTTDTPGIHFSTGANTNWGMDSSAGTLRTVQNLDETGAVVVATLSASGQYRLNSTGNAMLRLSSSAGSALIYDLVGTGTNFNIGDGTTNILVANASNATFSGTVTSTFQSLSADPTTLDLSAGQIRTVKNTTSGVIKTWVNDGGTIKASPAFT